MIAMPRKKTASPPSARRHRRAAASASASSSSMRHGSLRMRSSTSRGCVGDRDRSRLEQVVALDDSPSRTDRRAPAAAPSPCRSWCRRRRMSFPAPRRHRPSPGAPSTDAAWTDGGPPVCSDMKRAWIPCLSRQCEPAVRLARRDGQQPAVALRARRAARAMPSNSGSSTRPAAQAMATASYSLGQQQHGSSAMLPGAARPSPRAG